MKRFAGFLVWILVMAGEGMAVCQTQLKTHPVQQADTLRINHRVHAKNRRILDIFQDILRGSGAHGGFAEVSACSELPTGSLTVEQGTTIRDAMEALVATAPAYEWDVDGSVVNLIPRGGVPLLRTMVVKYRAETTDLQIPSALGGLLNLPEVRERESALGLKQESSGGGPSAIPKHPVPRQLVPVSVNIQNLSLRKAFNTLVQSIPNGMWVYHETDCSGDKSFTFYTATGY